MPPVGRPRARRECGSKNQKAKAIVEIADLIVSRIDQVAYCRCIAIPRLPGVSGNSSRIARPLSVSLDGLATTSAPHSWIIERRNGF